MAEDKDVLYQLSKSLYSKFTALNEGGEPNAFYTAINGKLYEDRVPDGTDFPYAVYHIISSVKERTFTEELRDTLIQLSIFSTSMSSTEIKDLYYKAGDLFDEKALTITGSDLIWLREENLSTILTDETTPDGNNIIRQYIIDYSAYTSLE
jgi:hypothetical protein